ncbi:PREDICTED: BAHD acyltransferase At5g47980-like [Camelina sativa]|uniref:BAHD acyltransferase At5g47980-like n=1 Tax=Camelina sativa TaxID=90675 RepID=A0ABM1RA75_CAMSA|nr:PREDICTED: BAHD acyltransferase At5g47980-like [Camelina sativa]
MELNLEEVKREVIKPASASDSPTPHNDQIQLSIVDFSSPPIYVSTIFFYNNTNDLNSETTSLKLKTSLSQTLSRFYPLAGRIDGSSITCNDEGAVFTEARTDLLLSDYLKTLNTDESFEKLLPTTAPGESPTAWPLVNVKVSSFGPGSGVAVAVGISHLICDAASLFTFVSDWAATTKGNYNDLTVSSPLFASTTIYPPANTSFQVPKMDALTASSEKCVTKRFVFESSKIAELKSKAASETVAVPTRVEAITALIWKCATKAASSRCNWSSMINLAMDIRLRTSSDILSQDAIGNLLTSFFLKKEPGSVIEIDQIVAQFRKAKEGVNEMIKESATTATLGQNLMKKGFEFVLALRPDTNLYVVTSWCMIWKCATKAASSRCNWSSMINLAMDIRLRTSSDILSQDAIGNLLTSFFLKKEPGSVIEIDQIVAQFRKAKEGVNEMIKESATTATLGQNLMKKGFEFVLALRPDTNLYVVTSWCSKRFYEVDFGMGVPVWIGPSIASVLNNKLCILLMDARDGKSVEAWIGLPEQDMAVFMRDEDLLAYASLNPTILI